MKKNAILFSAGNYINSPILSVPSLSGVKYDIQAINKRLTQIGFDVNQIEDVSKAQFIPALENNASNSPSDAIHIVYFSGHGGHTNGNNYIYPIDFSPLLNNSRNLEASAVVILFLYMREKDDLFLFLMPVVLISGYLKVISQK